MHKLIKQSMDIFGSCPTSLRSNIVYTIEYELLHGHIAKVDDICAISASDETPPEIRKIILEATAGAAERLHNRVILERSLCSPNTRG